MRGQYCHDNRPITAQYRPEGLLDAAVVRDVLALGVEPVQTDAHLRHREVAVLVCTQN